MQPTLSIKQFKAGFFDRVQNKVDKVKAKNLSKAGAFIRRTDKSSLKYRKPEEDAPAGKPPYVHRSERFTRERVNKRTGKVTRQRQSPLRELIFFALDKSTKTVVIGPALLGGRRSPTVPEVQEKGGTIIVRRIVRQANNRRRAHSQSQADAYRRLVQSGAITPPAQPRPTITGQAVKIRPHPHTGPAMMKEIASGKIAGVWANSVK